MAKVSRACPGWMPSTPVINSEVTSSMADQVGSVATNYADKGAEMTSAASEQAKTVTTELEGMARRNPLGTIAAAVLIGVFIGLLGRRN